jgi:hypothetical protein
MPGAGPAVKPASLLSTTIHLCLRQLALNFRHSRADPPPLKIRVLHTFSIAKIITAETVVIKFTIQFDNNYGK